MILFASMCLVLSLVYGGVAFFLLIYAAVVAK
jgi:hypothetical protein